jgi:hypothetical protein
MVCSVGFECRVDGVQLLHRPPEPAEFYAMGKVTPFVGERLRFRTKKTFLRGHEAFDRETGVHTRAPVMRVECPAKS